LCFQGCKGHLEDTIINFYDNLEEEILDRAMQMAKKSDVILCLGTTLMVTPAADIVEMAAGKLPLIICNR
jgi:NAD-dependent SIR2 family protein deacetylase